MNLATARMWSTIVQQAFIVHCTLTYITNHVNLWSKCRSIDPFGRRLAIIDHMGDRKARHSPRSSPLHSSLESPEIFAGAVGMGRDAATNFSTAVPAYSVTLARRKELIMCEILTS
jgi:hypothetical protein